MRKVVLALVLLVVGVTVFAKEIKRTKYILFHQNENAHVAIPFPENDDVECIFWVPGTNNTLTYTHTWLKNDEEQSSIGIAPCEYIKDLARKNEFVGSTYNQYLTSEMYEGATYLKEYDATVEYRLVDIKDLNGKSSGFCSLIWIYTEPQSNQENEIANLVLKVWSAEFD